MTQKVARISTITIWLVPFVVILVLFSSMPGQGFLSDGCTNHAFLTKFTFRMIYSSLILVPTLFILLTYFWFHKTLWGKRDVSKTAISKQNIKAAKTTLMIILTCMMGWLPATINHLLICDEGCKYQLWDFSMDTILIMHSITYSLLFMKSFTNPLIFALRQKNINLALKRMLYIVTHCKDKQYHALNRFKSGKMTKTSILRVN